MAVPTAMTRAPESCSVADRYAVELRLSAVAEGGGIAPLVHAVGELTGNAAWLLDPRERVVASSATDPPIPALASLLAALGPDGTVPALRERGLARRHLVTPVAREGRVFSWLVVAEHPTRFTATDGYVVRRAARYLATEYATQQRIARVAWNARANLARQLIRGTAADADLRASAEYLGVDLGADRVIAFVLRAQGSVDVDRVAELLTGALHVDVLPVRGSEGIVLAVESPASVSPVVLVGRVKHELVRALESLGDKHSVAGVSAVARPGQLRRAYRDAREVALCVARFAAAGTRVVAADDLGPARLFLANSDVNAVRAYPRDVLGALLTDAPGSADLLRTLRCFFDTGRRVRESAGLLGVHENTVRLRLAKVHDLTGLDVAAAPNDQLSAQTALLVLRLRGHPALSDREEST